MPADSQIYGQQQPFKINTPFENLSQVLQVRQQQENARGLKEQREAIAEQRRALTEKTSQENATRTAASQALQKGGAVRGETLKWALENAPDTVAGLTDFFDKADEKAETIKKLRRQAQNDEADFLGDVADGALKHGGTPEAVKTALSYAVEHFPDYADGAQKIAAQLAQASPEQVRGFLENIVAQSPSRRGKNEPPMTVSEGQGVLNPSTGKYEVPIPKPEKVPEPPKLGTPEDFIARYATERHLKPEQLSTGDIAKATRLYEQSKRDPSTGPKPTYEWANVGGKNEYLTPEEIRAKGATKPLTAMEGMDERKYKKAEPVLRSISDLSEKINTGKGIMAKMAGGAAKLAAKANYDDDVAEYQAVVSGFTPMVARALGHTGVLTQQDVDSVKMLFPAPGDSKTLRDRKMSRVLSIIGDLEGATSGPAKPVTPHVNETPEQRIKRLVGGG